MTVTEAMFCFMEFSIAPSFAQRSSLRGVPWTNRFAMRVRVASLVAFTPSCLRLRVASFVAFTLHRLTFPTIVFVVSVINVPSLSCISCPLFLLDSLPRQGSPVELASSCWTTRPSPGAPWAACHRGYIHKILFPHFSLLTAV